ncbi:MAG: hypothetical protein M5R41_06795 [Bacteroidia bacterium]|nr:hypothetical protein [Bacteroidia bacterium]
MPFTKHIVVLAGLVLVTAFLACEKQGKSELEKEMDLVVKAGKGELSSDDKEMLRKDGHPLLMQLSDTNTATLIALFAKLPTEAHRTLLDSGYLKWKFAQLDLQRQQVWRDIVQLNIDMASRQGATPSPLFSQAALQHSEVGFAVIDIPEAQAKVISWYILWTEGQPTWVTVVGAKAAGTQPYFSAHLRQLPLLTEKPESRLPS